MRQLAVLSDIHGNARALSAVIADLERRGIETIVNLGDCLYGPFDPRPAADLLMALDWPTVAGNEDGCLVNARGLEHSTTARFTANRLRASHLDWLASLPRAQNLDDLAIAFHGTPADETTYLLHRPSADGGMRPRRAIDIEAQLEGIGSRLILCGHDHMPRAVRLDDGRTIVNPGSVGCPAYTDGPPIPHAVENHTPHARYAMVIVLSDRIDVTPVAVAYDWNAAAAEAEKNGFHDWSRWIATGRA